MKKHCWHDVLPFGASVLGESSLTDGICCNCRQGRTEITKWREVPVEGHGSHWGIKTATITTNKDEECPDDSASPSS